MFRFTGPLKGPFSSTATTSTGSPPSARWVGACPPLEEEGLNGLGQLLSRQQRRHPREEPGQVLQEAEQVGVEPAGVREPRQLRPEGDPVLAAAF